MAELKGKLLIASPDMLDPNFARTVTLLIEHSDDGALGLVLNRPMNVGVAEAWSQVSDDPCGHEGMLFKGGPCPGPLMVLHTDHDQADARVVEPICFSTDRDHVTALLRGDAQPVRCFVNYAGWAGGQLEAELEQGTWVVTAASFDDVFADTDVWLSLLRRINPAQAAMIERPDFWPEDPSVN